VCLPSRRSSASLCLRPLRLDHREGTPLSHALPGRSTGLKHCSLAAIAASDALCCRLLGERSRGQDHRDAVALLEQVRFGTGTDQAQAQRARDLARALATALDLKDDSHYGTLMVGATELRRLIRAAEVLVSAAVEVT
jgi:hypothetical protein